MSYYFLPFYWLAVTTNLIMGLILSFLDTENESYNEKYPFLRDPTFLLVLFIFSGCAAVFKLFMVAGGGLPIIGDFLPVISGLAGSAVFFYRWVTLVQPEKTLPAFFSQLMPFQRIIGFVCLSVGLLHLLFSFLIFL